MSENPIVSVVIPLYNKEGTIARAIDSVLSQTINDFELIIVDGHSTDNSLNIAKRYLDSRITIFTQKGSGVSAARNQGIAGAKSQLIAFLDADDYWMPNFLEKIMDMYKQYPDAGMYGTAFSVYQSNKFVQNIIIDVPDNQPILSSYFKSFVDAGHPIIITSAFASRKEVLTAVGEYPEQLKIGEDHELFGKIALNYPVAYSPSVCARYYLDSENNTNTANYILEVPLERYFSANYSMQQARMFDFSIYMDHWRFRIGARNIYSGFRKEGRKQLNAISSNKYFVLKSIFILISLLPFNLSKISPITVRSVLRVVGLSI